MLRIKTRTAQTAVKIGLVCCYFLLTALMFIFGRTHTVLIDNAPFNGIKAIDGCTIQFGTDKPIEMFSGDRDKLMLRGQKHQAVIRFLDGTADVTASISIPLFEDAVLVSIPALVAGKAAEAVSPFELYKDTPEE